MFAIGAVSRSFVFSLNEDTGPPTTCVCAPPVSSTVVICLSLGDLNNYLSILSVFILFKASSRKHAFVSPACIEGLTAFVERVSPLYCCSKTSAI